MFMRVMSISGSPGGKCPGSANGGVEFLGYWCVALGSLKGFELIFEGGVVTDIAWAALQPSLSMEVVAWIIEGSGIEDYFDVTLITPPGCRTPSIVVLIPKSINGLMRLYKRGLGGAKFVDCPIPRREAYMAWLKIVDGLINAIGVDELLRYALKQLIGGVEEDRGNGSGRDSIHELLQAFR